MMLIYRRTEATPKALRTSAQPGLTRALSTRLKLSLDPLVYSYDSPGVMLPFLGKGARGAERGVKLALIGKFPLTQSVPLPTRRVVSSTCRQRRSNQSVYSTAGIKESLHDLEALASYLLYRLNVLDPIGTARTQPPFFCAFIKQH